MKHKHLVLRIKDGFAVSVIGWVVPGPLLTKKIMFETTSVREAWRVMRKTTEVIPAEELTIGTLFDMPV